MISNNVDRSVLDATIQTLREECARTPELAERIADLYDRARKSKPVDSTLEESFRVALQNMDAAIADYNAALIEGGHPAVALDQLVPRLVGVSAAAVKPQGADTPPILPIVAKLQARLEAAIVGQAPLREALMIAFMTGGHILLEGPPGTGKTKAVKVLGDSLDGDLNRIQCVADLAASDVTGSMTYDEVESAYKFKKGPVFGNMVLVDEINRAPPKTQSALLEAMSEGQVTVDGHSHPLPEGHIVFATQNPLDNRGTFPLPGAQLDRFMLSVKIPHATPEEDLEIMLREMAGSVKTAPDVSLAELQEVRKAVSKVAVPIELLLYAAKLIAADPQRELRERSGTRGAIALKNAAQARAYLDQRTVVSEEDIRAVAPSVLSHRVELKTEVADSDRTIADFIQTVLDSVPVPEAAAS